MLTKPITKLSDWQKQYLVQSMFLSPIIHKVLNLIIVFSLSVCSWFNSVCISLFETNACWSLFSLVLSNALLKSSGLFLAVAEICVTVTLRGKFFGGLFSSLAEVEVVNFCLFFHDNFLYVSWPRTRFRNNSRPCIIGNWRRFSLGRKYSVRVGNIACFYFLLRIMFYSLYLGVFTKGSRAGWSWIDRLWSTRHVISARQSQGGLLLIIRLIRNSRIR